MRPAMNTIEDASHDPREICLAIDFVDGISLENILAKGNISNSNIRALEKGLTETVKELHDRGVTYNDILSNNIIIQTSSNGKICFETPILIDLGEAVIQSTQTPENWK